MNEKTRQLPYAIMCALREIAGPSPSTGFKPIGVRRPSPEAMSTRRAYAKPLTAEQLSEAVPTVPESKYEYSASTQDLVDLGLIMHGFWHDGQKQTTQYGFHLTEKAVDILRSEADGAVALAAYIN